MKLVTAVFLAGILGCCAGARILALLAMPSRSHGILMERLIRELASKGHQITYVTGSPQMKDSVENITIIHIPGVMEAITPTDDGKAWDMFSLKGITPWFMFLFTLSGSKMSEHILQDPRVQALVKSDEKFDLVLAEAFLEESIMAGFSYKLKAPLVGVMSFMPNIWGNYLVGNPAPTSYIPDPNLGYSTDMTFQERLINFLYEAAWDFFHPNLYLNWQDEVMRKHFGKDTPHITEILRNTSVVLVNHHYALAFPRPYLPNMVEVAGMHINPVKPLPESLQKYLDDSKKGAILFSMGSNLKSADLGPERIKMILKVFAKLPYNVLWKFEADLPNLPKNVKIDKWLPQNDILAHPNLKLFITHGGLLSTTEAVYRGVPVLGIPIFGDQPLNMKHTENAGLGKTLDFSELSEETLYNSIVEVTTNPSYENAAKMKSLILRDNIVSSLDKAIWWIEYVIRHKGAPHLRSSAQNLSYYQLYQMDVLTVITVAGLLSIYVNFVILRCIFRRLFSRKSSPKAKKSAKKNN